MDASCAYTHHAREAPYIPVVDLLLVPSLFSLGGGDFGILQLALPHLVNGLVGGTRGVLPLLGGRFELRDLA